MPKTLKPWRAFFVTMFCTALLVPTSLQQARASIIEFITYDVVVALVALIQGLAAPLTELPQGSEISLDQLENAVQAARTANLLGDRVTEASRLSKAIGAAEALNGMTSACSDCDGLRSRLQEFIGDAALLKTDAVGASGSCHPNGVLQPNEQCDPLAIPTGCPVAVELTFCSDECRCVPVP